jgi:hypothetical protein
MRGMDGTYAFLSLPSQCIKGGKITRVGLSYEVLCEYARAMALGYPNIPEDYPILGVFLKMMHKLGRKPTMSRIDYVERAKPYKVLGEADPNFKLDVRAAEQMIEERYGLTVGDIRRMEKKMEKVTVLPWIVVDPGFVRLQEIDY